MNPLTTNQDIPENPLVPYSLTQSPLTYFNGGKSVAAKDKQKKTKKKRTLKRMSCHPIVKGKTPVEGSCFTEDTLQKIRRAFNKSHHEDPIPVLGGRNLWTEINMRMSKCSKEDCWLNTIEDEGIRKQIDMMSFAPDQPKEWRKNPRDWLSNFDILAVLEQYEKTFPVFKFIGPTPIDFDHKLSGSSCVWQEMCDFSVKKYLHSGVHKIGIVLNLDPHDKDGSHWVAMFIDLADKFIIYFDSNGIEPPKEVDVFAKRIRKQAKDLGLRIKYYENEYEHQMRNGECGMYALYFIITLLTGRTPNQVFKSVKEKIDYFMKKRIYDNWVYQFRTIYFNK